jgi:hypothetical protein
MFWVKMEKLVFVHLHNQVIVVAFRVILVVWGAWVKLV